MAQDRRDRVDIPGVTSAVLKSERSAPDANQGRTPRKWLGIWFRCCETYGRLYKSRDGSRYEGACPRCGTPSNVPVGPGGTSNRFFEAR